MINGNTHVQIDQPNYFFLSRTWIGFDLGSVEQFFCQIILPNLYSEEQQQHEQLASNNYQLFIVINYNTFVNIYYIEQ